MTTAVSTTRPDQPVGLYLLNLQVGNAGTPGAPILHLNLLVDAPTGKVTGHGNITQAIQGPDSDIQINNLQGEIHDLGFGPNVTVLALTGDYIYNFPPPAIGTAILKFTASLILPQDGGEGRGSFTYGQHTVKDVPVTTESA